MSIFWKTKTLLAKVETAYGTDANPSGAANAILALNVNLSPMEGEDVERDTEKPHFGADPSVPSGLYQTLSFDVEAAGSGAAGTAPAFGPLLRMCGVAEVINAGTSVEYSPITSQPESGSIYFQVSQTRHIMLGVRGNCVFKVNAQGIPMFSFTLTGLFTVPTKQPAVTPDFSAFQDPQVATNANTPDFSIGGLDFNMGSFEFDFGNDVQRRFRVGYEGIHIVDKAEAIRTNVDAVEVDVYDPFTIAKDQTKQAIALTHGTGAGRQISLAVPSAQQRRLSGYENNQNILEWPLQFTPLPVSGDDQWVLTFS